VVVAEVVDSWAEKTKKLRILTREPVSIKGTNGNNATKQQSCDIDTILF
jgi:hypothetical protein